MAQEVTVRGKKYFVCEYTGALLQHYYSIPHGKNLTQKTGCYATLPVLLRAVMDEEKEGIRSERFRKIKHDCEIFYTQPDIPIQPALPEEKCPIGMDALCDYLEQLELGLTWTAVPNSVSDEKRKKKKSKTSKN